VGVPEMADGAEDEGRLTGRGDNDAGRMGSATVSMLDLSPTVPKGAAQFPQNRLEGGFSVAQLEHLTIGCSVASDLLSRQSRNFRFPAK
jgi:hypothetical protein